ncbi:FAD-containing oxidoreductase [Streptococcus ruminantium]|uniref:FAD-containing oxidoreductase n=1 Tax=Streptococcus ruminantium TaxID=1917441 RepID=UPI001F02C821|nr:FAD-containing oxidoreductase [Streptococcus ruminantium]BDD38825.1 pyruvate dehydrogenase complex E3 component dihydrolipoamide dehydrogenase [Streptococcus ruminantium]
MKQYDLLVIGFGKAGKTLAGKLAAAGKKVALVEENPAMFGGTCINIGCIPTKTLLVAADKNWTFEQVMDQKETVTTRLRNKNEAVLKGSGANLYQGHARFVADKIVEVSAGSESIQLTAETIVINTGAKSRVLPIPGLLDTPHVYDSTGIQNLKTCPDKLAIIGGGNIGLEFAGLYNKLGSQVTVYEASPTILPKEEEVVAKLAKEYMEETGVTFEMNARIERVEAKGEQVAVTIKGEETVFDAVLYATGRVPNTADLGLENTTIAVSENGAIKVDDYCETTVSGVYAVGDVNGGPQFTYTSLDDFRIVFGKLTGTGNYCLSQRKSIPTSVFITPVLSRVGLTENEAKEAGYDYITNELPVINMPRAHVNNDLKGIFKVIVDKETKLVLGATLFGRNSEELINLIAMAIDNKIPYTYFKTQIFTHPTMAENLNDVFNF